MVRMPQFPLGTVLFPSMVLPLHIFEPRYRVMIEHVLAADDRFGVVLIERGSEVGGDDRRTDFGTVAQVVESEQLSDGRWAVVSVGVERFKVDHWHEDDPYPIAEVTPWPDEAPTAAASADLADRYDRVVASFRRCMALAAESGVDVGQVPETFSDIELGCIQMAALAPVTAHDKQRLLGAPGPEERLPMLEAMLDDALELIELRLRGS